MDGPAKNLRESRRVRLRRRIQWGIFLLLIEAAQMEAGVGLSSTCGGGTWGVDGGLVYSIVTAGDVVYVGGSFTQIVSPDGSIALPAQRRSEERRVGKECR